MTTYINCERPKTPFGRITCNHCNTQYDFDLDPIQAPYKEEGILKCNCGVDLVKWNSTREPYLVRVKN